MYFAFSGSVRAYNSVRGACELRGVSDVEMMIRHTLTGFAKSNASPGRN